MFQQLWSLSEVIARDSFSSKTEIREDEPDSAAPAAPPPGDLPGEVVQHQSPGEDVLPHGQAPVSYRDLSLTCQ